MKLIGDKQKLEKLYQALTPHSSHFENVDSLYEAIKHNKNAIEIETILTQDKWLMKILSGKLKLELNWRFHIDSRHNERSKMLDSWYSGVLDWDSEDYCDFEAIEISEEVDLKEDKEGVMPPGINYDNYEYPFAIRDLYISLLKDNNGNDLCALINITYSNKTFNIKGNETVQIINNLLKSLDIAIEEEKGLDSKELRWWWGGALPSGTEVIDCTKECFPKILSDTIKQIDNELRRLSLIVLTVGDCKVELHIKRSVQSSPEENEERHYVKKYAIISGLIDGYRFKRECELKEKSILRIINQFFQRQI